MCAARCRTERRRPGRLLGWTTSSVQNGCSGVRVQDHVFCVEWTLWSEGAGPRLLCRVDALECGCRKQGRDRAQHVRTVGYVPSLVRAFLGKCSQRFAVLPGGSCSRLATQVLKHLYCCSVVKLYLPLCDPMDCSTPGFPILHCLPEFAQTCPLSR